MRLAVAPPYQASSTRDGTSRPSGRYTKSQQQSTEWQQPWPRPIAVGDNRISKPKTYARVPDKRPRPNLTKATTCNTAYLTDVHDNLVGGRYPPKQGVQDNLPASIPTSAAGDVADTANTMDCSGKRFPFGIGRGMPEVPKVTLK